MKYIFIDTNIFLHYQDFTEIDWLDEASVHRCTLIIPPIVMDELDEKKIGTNRISKRARRVLNLFEELIDSQNKKVRENIEFEILLNKPLQNIYDENDLNYKEQDHRLIASIIDFRQRRETNNIVLCTYDIGPRLRAKQYGIESLKLGDKYLLPNQESEEQKKIKKLEEEIRTLKSRLPNLTLKFDNLEEFIKFQIKEIEYANFEKYKTKKLQEIKIKHPYIQHVDPYKDRLAFLNLGMSLTPDQIDSYNNKLDKYYSDYEKVLDELFEQEKKAMRTFELNIKLVNDGTAPAEDIDIHLHFPDGFELIESDKIENNIEIPEPPYRPKHKLDYGYLSTGLSSVSPYVNIANNMNVNINPPTIKKTNSYDVDYYRKHLKHGYKETLESLSIIFETYSEIDNFKIDYEISSGNIPEITKGKLNIIFEK